jgi:hypothetical protein
MLIRENINIVIKYFVFSVRICVVVVGLTGSNNFEVYTRPVACRKFSC